MEDNEVSLSERSQWDGGATMQRPGRGFLLGGGWGKMDGGNHQNHENTATLPTQALFDISIPIPVARA